MARRTKLQRKAHQDLAREMLVHGASRPKVIRRMAHEFGLTPRQVRHDLRTILDAWQREDEAIRLGHSTSRDLSLTSDRCERVFEKALEGEDARGADVAERERCKQLGLYPAQRKKQEFVPREKREELERTLLAQARDLHAAAPRNPDGSAVLTAYSSSRPPVEDEDYREQIEHPRGRRISAKRQRRLDTLRETLASGTRPDELEEVAAERFGLSARQIRRDMRLLMRQLDEEGQQLLQGTHPLKQSLPLALARREAIRELALKTGDVRLAQAVEADRAKLLGVYPGDRPPPRAPQPADSERMFEVEFARLDAAGGHRHTVAELLPREDGSPAVASRFPWREPEPTAPEYQQAPIDWDPADYRGDDLPEDYGDPRKRPEGVDPFS